jgi:predicted secreted acid phosphatase
MSMFSPHATRVSKDHQQLIRTLVKYHRSGEYLRDVARVGRTAMAYIKGLPPAKKQEKRAMVLDIDETSVINDWPHLLEPVLKGRDYDPKAWDRWVRRAEAPAAEQTRDVFHAARDRGIDVFFITGRPVFEQKYVALNLHRQGYEGYAEMITEPLTANGTPVFPNVNMYKVAARWSIVQRGYRIVLNMGDQASDVRGGYAEKTIQLPNPFYTVL